MNLGPLRAVAVPGAVARRLRVGLLLGAFGVVARWVLDPVLGAEVPYLLQAVAVVLATWVAGYVGGAAAAALAVVSAFWLPASGYYFALTLPERLPAFSLLVFVLALLVLQVGRWREAERQLRRRGEAYRALFENLPVGYARHRLMTGERGEPIDYEFLEVNQAFEQQTGLRRADVLGKRVTEVIPGIAETGLLEVYGAVALGSGPTALDKAVESLGRVYEIRAFSPAPGEVVTVFADVSERVRQAELVRRRAEELERLMEVAPVAIWVSRDLQCRVITGNRMANEFYDARPGENVSAAPEPGVITAQRRFFKNGRELPAQELPMQVAAARGIEVRDSEVEVLLPSGRRLFMWGHALPLRGAGGEVRGAVAAFLDVTERHLHEEELAQANSAKDEFLATLSHELRTPMNAILGWSHMMASGRLAPEYLPTATAAILRNAEAQRQLVEDVLDMSRIVRGKFQLRMVPVDLVSTIEKAAESVQSAADAKGLRLRLVESPGLPSVAADPDRLQQVFWNLLSNAIKFTPNGGGEIRIEVRQEEELVEVSVTDPGEGISPEFLPRLFERFSQADSSITRTHGGLGLGLAICRHLVELHGGTVSAESAGPGQGATFRVRLPVQQAVTGIAAAPVARSVGEGI